MSNEKNPTKANGKVCYIEIPATDIDAAVAFYRAVFDWNIRTRGDGHFAFDDGVGEVSGSWVTGRPTSGEPGLLIYIMVDDIDATIEKVSANGGKVVEPVDKESHEIIARFSDPAGNVLGLYEEPERQ